MTVPTRRRSPPAALATSAPRPCAQMRTDLGRAEHRHQQRALRLGPARGGCQLEAAGNRLHRSVSVALARYPPQCAGTGDHARDANVGRRRQGALRRRVQLRRTAVATGARSAARGLAAAADWHLDAATMAEIEAALEPAQKAAAHPMSGISRKQQGGQDRQGAAERGPGEDLPQDQQLLGL